MEQESKSKWIIEIDKSREKHKHPELPKGTGLCNVDIERLKYCYNCDQFCYYK